MKDLPRHPAPIRLDGEALAVLNGFIAHRPQRPDADARCATLVPSARGGWCVFPHAYDDWEMASARLERRPSAISASVVRSDWRQTGPWEVLAEVDFVRPHLMVQLGGKLPFLHAFVAAEDEDAWPWQEVTMDIRGVAEPGTFRWLPAEQAPAAEEACTRARALWRRVEAELRDVLISTEGDEHERVAR